MKISLNWLRDYIQWDLTTDDLAHQLTMAGLEVEVVDEPGKQFDGFVVGEVVEHQKHPNADRLSLCKVNVGSTEPLQIVCGAPNVAAGQKVAVGLVGATVPRDQHAADGTPLVLSRVKIRGVESFGMICSEYELGIGTDASGIMVLLNTAVPGTPLAKYFGLDDTVFEIGITPNRPDCMSHLGVAREVAALVGKKLTRPKTSFKESDMPASKAAAIMIKDPAACPRYTARVIRNVKVQDSPEWLQKRLKAVGLRPINNIVDVTNYVLMETGHPLHAFDYDLLEDHTIIVECAKNGEKFTTLDGRERTLRSDSLMICDGKKRVAIAGVMGGLNSEIRNETTDVLLESAYFLPSSVRRTSKYLGLSTDASQRFERGADPAMTTYAIDRAAQLIGETGGGEILKGTIDIYPKPIEPKVVPLRVDKVNELLGTALPDTVIFDSLAKIEFQIVEEEGEVHKVRVPTFRPDVEREVDLIEEVARVYGYGNVPDRTTAMIDFTSLQSSADIPEILREWFIGSGFHEAMTSSMQDPATAAAGNPNTVKVRNPLGVEMSEMRTSLIPGILQTIRHNQFHGTGDLRMFEIGHVFWRSGGPGPKTIVDNIIEEEHVVLAMVGNVHLDSWDEAPRDADIYDMKGEVESLFKKISLDKHRFIYYSTQKTLSESCIDIEISNTYAGFIGVIRQDVVKQYEVKGSVIVCELNIDVLRGEWNVDRRYVPVSKFPALRRDLAFIVDSKLAAEEMAKQIRESGGAILRQVKLFDIYAGERIGSGRKSLAFRLDFQSSERTLTDMEVASSVEKIIADAARKFGAELRNI